MAAGGTLIKRQSFEVDKQTPKWLVSARNDLGTREWVRNTDTPNPIVQNWVGEAQSGKRGATSTVDVTSTPWCAFYVGAKLVEAGYPSSRSGMARSYMRYGDPVSVRDTDKWKAGDIVVFWRGRRNDGVTGHVAFLLSWDANYVYVIGGNQGDKVSIMRNSREKILAIARPRSALMSRTILASAGSGTSQAAAKGIQVTVPDHASLVTPAHADMLHSSLAVDPSTLAPVNTPQIPSPEDLQAAYDSAHPYLSMLQSIKPELIAVFTLVSLGLACYAIWYRYQDYKEGHNT